MNTARLAVLLVALQGAASVEARGAEPSFLPEAIKSNDRDERLRAMFELIRLRADAIKMSISVIEEETRMRSDGSARAADSIRLLGRLRASEACAVLLENIDLPAPEFRGRPSLVPLERRFPAVKALAEIGSPAIDETLSALGSEKDDFRNGLFARVLVRICGWEVALLRVEQLESDPARVEGARKAKEFLYEGYALHMGLDQERDCTLRTLRSRGAPLQLRKCATARVGKKGFAEALPALRRIALDPREDLFLRAEAIWSIEKIGTREDLALLRKLHENLAERYSSEHSQGPPPLLYTVTRKVVPALEDSLKRRRSE